MNTLTQLLNLRDAVDKALGVAAADVGKPPHQQRLFASIEGMALVNAAFELFGCDDLYSLVRDIERDVCGPDESIPALPRCTTQIRKLNPSLFVDGEVR